MKDGEINDYIINMAKQRAGVAFLSNRRSICGKQGTVFQAGGQLGQRDAQRTEKKSWYPSTFSNTYK